MPLWGAGKHVGKRLGAYTLTALAGKGRYGVCFLAEADDGREVVIKRFKPRMYKKNGKKNEHEAVILSSLNDRRIPELLGVINQGRFYCFVLEYKKGDTLKDLLFKHKRRFTAGDIFNIGAQLIGILQYLHGNGVVHRDVRIPNVLLDGGAVYLIDFGLARWADGSQYPYNLDFSYLGDLLLYLLYSAYEKGKKKKIQPWYEELPLTAGQASFLKRLLGLAPIYGHIDEIKADFEREFRPL